jgi:hypothetical protein
MGELIQAVWWVSRIGMVALAVAFYYHFAVARGYGTPCDAPLLGYIVSVGALSTVLLLLRTAVFAVGIGDKPSSAVRFILLYPVLLHTVEVTMAAGVAGYILLPNEHCALPLSSVYVNWSSVLMVCSWLVAGLIYPLSFDTRPQHHAQRYTSGLPTGHGASSDAVPSGAGRLLRDLHGAVLLYRTIFGFGCAVTFVSVRGGLPGGAVSLRNDHSCTDPLVLWLLLELCFHLLSYCLTLYYASRALLAPQLDVALHETVYWVFLLGVQLHSACGGIFLVFAEDAPCYDEAPSLAYMARTGSVIASCFGLGAVCFAPCWLGQLRRRRERVNAGQRSHRHQGGHGAFIAAYGHLPMRNS